MVSSGPNKRKRVGLSLTISAKYFDKTFISILSFVSGKSLPRFSAVIGLTNFRQSGKVKFEESTPHLLQGLKPFASHLLVQNHATLLSNFRQR